MPYIRNKRTGETIFVPDQGPPPDPKFPYEGPQAAATLENTRARTRAIERQNDISDRKLGLENRKFEADEGKRKLDEKKRLDYRVGMAREIQDRINKIDQIYKDTQDSAFLPGLGETGWLGSKLRDMPGTAAYDLGQDLDYVKSGIARAGLTKMRQESPTGASVGNPSDRDIGLFEKSLGSLDANQTQDNFEKNLREARTRHIQLLRSYAPKTAARLEANSPWNKDKSGDPSRGGVKFLGWDD